MGLPIALFAASLSLSGCAATRPNTSAIYQMSSLKKRLPPVPDKQLSAVPKNLPVEAEVLFERLYDLDPGLALEVGKLPEFQKAPGPEQITALSRFTDLTARSTDQEKENLQEFLKIGLPAVRPYSTPLQAMFWILERDGNSEGNPLKCYASEFGSCLSNLLREAWDYNEKDRWSDYSMVTERLNVPELVDYYERDRFIYVFRADHVGYPFDQFKTNKGQCADVTAFTIACLRKGGYKAWDHHVTSPSGYSYHHVTLFEKDGRKYIMDNGRPDKLSRRGIVPFEEYSPF